MATLAKPRVLIPLVAVIALLAAGILFLHGPLEVPSLQISPLTTIAGYPLRNSVLTTWIVMAIILVLAFLSTRNMKLVPSGLQNFMETVIEGFLTLVTNVAGEKNGRRFFPLVASIFLFVVCANWFGLLPGIGTVGKVVPAEEVLHEAEEHGTPVEDVKLFVMQDNGVIPIGLNYKLDGKKVTANEISGAEWEKHHAELEEQHLTAGHLNGYLRPANTDVNTPLALAIMSFIFVEFWGISTLGFFPYMGKFFNFRKLLRGNIFMGIIDVFVGLLELISELVRLMSFTFRLFGNVFAGEVLLLVFSFLIPLVVPLGAYSMELFFGLIQAFVFAMLTLVFAIMAVSHHGEEEHGHAEHGPAEHGAPAAAAH